LFRKPERKRPLGRPRRRWENNIKKELKEVGYRVRTDFNLFRIRTCCGLFRT
jgi:hypothetical protein